MNNEQQGLTREDIHLYQSTNDERIKHSIEKKSLENDFDADALEGWSDLDHSVLKMKSSSEVIKGKASSGTFKIYLVSLVGIVATHLFFMTTVFVHPKYNAASAQLVKIEKSDLEVPAAIEQLQELPENALINPILVKKDSQKIKKAKLEEATPLPDNTNDDSHQEQTIAPPQKKEIETSKMPDASTLSTKTTAKEVYLVDLKLIDYRAYRSKPTVRTEQAILTGTPANESGFEGKTEEEFEWKTVEIPYVDYLEKTMTLFSKGNNKKALVRFEEILKTYPDDINALFYGGLCYYNLGEFDKAITSFLACEKVTFNNFDEEAEWYTAKAYLAKKDIVKANELFQDIANRNGYYSGQAKTILKNQKR